MIPARLVETLEDNRVRCRLCAHYCIIKEGESGICGVRRNQGGRLYSLNYRRVIAASSDPIEKKPLYHFLPGSRSFSLATMGCNFRCRFCQNHSISQVDPDRGLRGEPLTPEELVRSALAAGCGSMAYTYTEPTIFFELMLDTAELARSKGLKNVMITNGYTSPEGLNMLMPVMDGANVDLKAGSDGFYRQQCGARLQPVLDTITAMRRGGLWVEVTTLLIPGLNTDTAQLDRVISFLHDLDPEIPWHVSRYYPQYRMEIPPTEAREVHSALERAREAGLCHLYAGNLPDEQWTDTRCPGCGAVLVTRRGYSTRVMGMDGGKCAACGRAIAGVWE